MEISEAAHVVSFDISWNHKERAWQVLNVASPEDLDDRLAWALLLSAAEADGKFDLACARIERHAANPVALTDEVLNGIYRELGVTRRPTRPGFRR